MKTRSHRIAIGSLFALALLAGCEQKLTYNRWETVYNGADQELVRETLGKPWQTADGLWVYHDDERGITAKIYFNESGVKGKTWADPEHGNVGNSPNVDEPGESEDIHIRTME